MHNASINGQDAFVKSAFGVHFKKGRRFKNAKKKMNGSRRVVNCKEDCAQVLHMLAR